MTSRPHRTQRTNALGRTELLLLLAAVAILVAQQLAISNLGRDGAEAAFRRGIFFVTTPMLVGIALCFRRYWGAWLIAAGVLLNFLPIAAHGGLMPVSYTIVRDSGAFPEITEADIGRQLHNGKDILLRRDDIHFFALSDRYTVDAPLYGENIYSLGDFILFAGGGLMILQAIASFVPRKHHATTGAEAAPAEADAQPHL